MGYTTRKHIGGEITDFWPDDTDTKFYLAGGASLEEIHAEITARGWSGVPFSEIQITAEHIHTHCLGYDLYDAGDYTTFIAIERKTP